MKVLGDGFHSVGYPTNSGNGRFLSCYECVAVNKQAENREVIDDFLQFVLGEEMQADTEIGVRKDVILKEWESFESFSWVVVDVNEYLALMEKAPLFFGEDELGELYNIISEEAEAYFAGDKTEQKTAEVIQRRVQLYLDEHN